MHFQGFSWPKMRLRPPGLRRGPSWGAYSAPPDPPVGGKGKTPPALGLWPRFSASLHPSHLQFLSTPMLGFFVLRYKPGRTNGESNVQ